MSAGMSDGLFQSIVRGISAGTASVKSVSDVVIATGGVLHTALEDGGTVVGGSLFYGDRRSGPAMHAAIKALTDIYDPDLLEEALDVLQEIAANQRQRLEEGGA
jgi:hypothetical protein